MRFRSHLIALAKQSDHPRSQHAALVARGKSILAQAYNRGAWHAEANALAWAGNCRGATLYTLMVRKRSGKLGNGTPCNHCMDYIRHAGIKRVVVYI